MGVLGLLAAAQVRAVHRPGRRVLRLSDRAGAGMVDQVRHERCRATREVLWHTRRTMSETSTPVSVRLGAQGRLVVPAALREALGFKTGDQLVVRVQDGRLVVESRESVVRRVQERFGAPGRNLVKELIAERRREARREEKDV